MRFVFVFLLTFSTLSTIDANGQAVTPLATPAAASLMNASEDRRVPATQNVVGASGHTRISASGSTSRTRVFGRAEGREILNADAVISTISPPGVLGTLARIIRAHGAVPDAMTPWRPCTTKPQASAVSITTTPTSPNDCALQIHPRDG